MIEYKWKWSIYTPNMWPRRRKKTKAQLYSLSWGNLTESIYVGTLNFIYVSS